MTIIIDSNILFSALIKNSITRKLILEYDGLFIFPSYIFEEMENHKFELIRKSKMHHDDFESLLQLLLKKVIIVPKEMLFSRRNKAVSIMEHIDLDDAIFIACALVYPGSIIWSDDKHLKKQNEIKVFNTSEIFEFFNEM